MDQNAVLVAVRRGLKRKMPLEDILQRLATEQTTSRSALVSFLRKEMPEAFGIKSPEPLTPIAADPRDAQIAALQQAIAELMQRQKRIEESRQDMASQLTQIVAPLAEKTSELAMRLEMIEKTQIHGRETTVLLAHRCAEMEHSLAALAEQMESLDQRQEEQNRFSEEQAGSLQQYREKIAAIIESVQSTQTVLARRAEDIETASERIALVESTLEDLEKLIQKNGGAHTGTVLPNGNGASHGNGTMADNFQAAGRDAAAILAAAHRPNGIPAPAPEAAKRFAYPEKNSYSGRPDFSRLVLYMEGDMTGKNILSMRGAKLLITVIEFLQKNHANKAVSGHIFMEERAASFFRQKFGGAASKDRMELYEMGVLTNDGKDAVLAAQFVTRYHNRRIEFVDWQKGFTAFLNFQQQPDSGHSVIDVSKPAQPT